MPGLSARCVLPAAPPPSPGELLAFWVGRLACLYDAPPQDLWCELAGSAPAEFGWNCSGLTIGGGQLLEQFCADRHRRTLGVWAPVAGHRDERDASRRAGHMATIGDRIDVSGSLVSCLRAR